MAIDNLLTVYQEKTRWGQNKDAVNCFEQILKAVPNKIIAVRPLASHLTKYPSKITKTCWTLLKKQRQIDNQFLFIIYQDYVQQMSIDIMKKKV